MHDDTSIVVFSTQSILCGILLLKEKEGSEFGNYQLLYWFDRL